VQVKKQEVREAILSAAFALFSAKGYANTTLPQIAQRAGVSTTNLYIYFDSKLALLYAIHGPWIQAQFEALEADLRKTAAPRARLRVLLRTLFRDLPAREGGFANNIIQAIATVGPKDRYRPSLMAWLEERLGSMLALALPALAKATPSETGLAHFLMMAFDGYIVFHKIAPDRGCDDATIEFLCDLFEARAGESGTGKVRRATAGRPATAVLAGNDKTVI
jgi:AcrR family transcriptional regulator